MKIALEGTERTCLRDRDLNGNVVNWYATEPSKSLSHGRVCAIGTRTSGNVAGPEQREAGQAQERVRSGPGTVILSPEHSSHMVEHNSRSPYLKYASSR